MGDDRGLTERLTAPDPTQSTITAATALASLVPGAGFVAALVQEWQHRRERAQLGAVLTEWYAQMEAIRDRLDKSFTQTPEFAQSAEEYLEAAVHARNAAKLRHFGAILARTATTQRPGEAERGLMTDVLDAMRPVHLRLLAAVASDNNPPESAADYFRPGDGLSMQLIAQATPN